MHTPAPRCAESRDVSPSVRDSLTDLLGTKLDGGRYEILDPIGAGGVGVVYRGRQAPLGRGVAIKLMRGPHTAHPESIAAFWREARAAALIDHPNVVRLIDFGNDEVQGFFIVMELLDGRRVEQVLARTPVPPLAWTCRVVADVLAALAAAHDQGVVHQDVKPENVLLHSYVDSDGDEVEVAKLCDFGLAALLKVIASGEQRRGSGGLRGTPAYMAPEQVLAEPVTPATDLYACGVMLYQLATGRLPFDGDNPVAVALRHLDTTPPLPSSVAPDIDPELEAVILRAMARQPGDRFPDARHMRAALLTILNGPGEPHDDGPALTMPAPCRDDDETRPYTPLRTLPQWALEGDAAIVTGAPSPQVPAREVGGQATPAEALAVAVTQRLELDPPIDGGSVSEALPDQLLAAALRESPWPRLVLALCMAAVPAVIWWLAQ